jgi:hypothetical protein
MLSCKYCGTTTRKDGRKFDKQGQLNLHEYHCKMKSVSRETLDFQTETCKHDFRLLNLNQPMELKAYKANYKEVCSKCQELH